MAAPRRSRQWWSKTIARFHESGMTAEVFAGVKGVKLSTLRWWISKLRTEGDNGLRATTHRSKRVMMAPADACEAIVPLRVEMPVVEPAVRLDNNISEAALWIIALGRDNFRWVGHDVSGHNLAVLQTVVATCVANGVNPQDYIADVFVRVQTHPAARIDELLPMNWVPRADIRLPEHRIPRKVAA